GSLSVQAGFGPSGHHFTIIDNGGFSPVSGTFSGLPEGALIAVGPRIFSISYQGGDGNDVVLTRLPSVALGDIASLRQFGTAGSEGALGMAANSRGVYVGGGTSDTFPDQAGGRDQDASVRKYDAVGNVADRVLGEIAGHSLDEALLDELALSVPQPI